MYKLLTCHHCHPNPLSSLLRQANLMTKIFRQHSELHKPPIFAFPNPPGVSLSVKVTRAWAGLIKLVSSKCFPSGILCSSLGFEVGQANLPIWLSSTEGPYFHHLSVFARIVVLSSSPLFLRSWAPLCRMCLLHQPSLNWALKKSNHFLVFILEDAGTWSLVMTWKQYLNNTNKEKELKQEGKSTNGLSCIKRQHRRWKIRTFF
jgi:hypothetical protein